MTQDPSLEVSKKDLSEMVKIYSTLNELDAPLAALLHENTQESEIMHDQNHDRTHDSTAP